MIFSGIGSKFKEKQKDFLKYRKSILIHWFTLYSASLTFIFSIIDFFLHRIGAGILLGMTSLSMAFVFYENHCGKTKLPENLTLINGTILFSFLFLEGGIMNSGFIWLIVWPIVPVYLKGKKAGLFWILALYTICSAAVLFKGFGLYPIKYETMYLLIVAAVGLSVTSFTLVFEHARDKTSTFLKKVSSDLKEVNQSLEIRNLEIAEDLFIAKQMQKNLLRTKTDYPDFDVSIHYEPLSHISGDLYDICFLGNKRYRIFIADASDRSIRAALKSSFILVEYNRIKKSMMSPGEILSLLNQTFSKNYAHLNLVFSCFLVDLDFGTNMIHYASAGHINQYVINQTDFKRLKIENKMIGQQKYSSTDTHDFNKGNKLLLFTDGLLHNNASTKKIVAFEKSLVQQTDIHQYIKNILPEKNMITDDITVLCIENS